MELPTPLRLQAERQDTHMWYFFAIAITFLLAAGHRWGREQGGVASLAFPLMAAGFTVGLMVAGDQHHDTTMRGAGAAALVTWLVSLTLLGAWGSRPSRTHA